MGKARGNVILTIMYISMERRILITLTRKKKTKKHVVLNLGESFSKTSMTLKRTTDSSAQERHVF